MLVVLPALSMGAGRAAATPMATSSIARKLRARGWKPHGVRRLTDQPCERDERGGGEHEQCHRAGSIEPVQNDHGRSKQQ
jgi:hypothetical protein